MAFSSLNRIKLKKLAEKSKRAALALKLLDMFDKILSTVLIGNNIANIASSALAAMIFISLFGAKGVSVSTVIMTALVLLLGEITPKTIAKEMPEMTALRNAPLLRFFNILFSPLNYLIAKWKKIIIKIFSVKQDRSVTEDELLTFVGEVRQEGGINRQEEEMIRQVIEFDELIAEDIFVPRVDVAAVPQNCAIEEIDNLFLKTGFSRLPVYSESLDNITGVILLKDFHHHVLKEKKTLDEITKPAVFITKTIKISRLLKTLQLKQSHLAVVVDEFGGTLGIVTVEDIVEQLVGDIWDEHDKVVEEVKEVRAGCYAVMGMSNFAEMVKSIPAASPPERGEIPDTTVANWIIESLGRLPQVGEELLWGNLKITATKIIRHRIMEVYVKVDK
jgi:CBS domain containing-hemolysin-like protein